MKNIARPFSFLLSLALVVSSVPPPAFSLEAMRAPVGPVARPSGSAAAAAGARPVVAGGVLPQIPAVLSLPPLAALLASPIAAQAVASAAAAAPAAQPVLNKAGGSAAANLASLQAYVQGQLSQANSEKPSSESDPLQPLFDNSAAHDAAPAVAEPAAASAAAKEWSASLLKYHRLDGLQDGSGLTGVQYPPIPGVATGDEAGLRKFIQGLSNFLGSRPEIVYNPSPADPEGRAAFRLQVAKGAAADIQSHAKAEFDAMVDGLKNPAVKLFVQKALAASQPEFWQAPSSSTGKYHPADEINFAGLLVHTMRNAVLSRQLAGYLGFPSDRQDILTAALLLHDVQKGGIPWKHDVHPGDAPASGYVADHGPVAAKWLEQFKGECGADCDTVIDMVDTHMAQWNKPTPTPARTIEELLTSYSDYLASQDNFYVGWRTSAAGTAPSPVKTASTP